MFSQSTLESLRPSSRLSGILVLEGDAPVEGFSPDDKAPLKQWGLHPDIDYAWNTVGTGLNYEAFEFPIFGLNMTESAMALERALANQDGGYTTYPRYGAILNAQMSAAVNTQTAIRRSRADPLGGRSVWATLARRVVPGREMVLATAALDANAFFHDMAWGANNDISGVVAVLGAVDALRAPNVTSLLQTLPREIAVGLFTGEAWGYLGSTRFVHDIVTPFECSVGDDTGGCKQPYQTDLEFTKVKLDSFVAAIDARQVGGTATSLYGHRELAAPYVDVNDTLLTLLSTVAKLSDGVPVAAGQAPAPFDTTDALPPSSLASFLKSNPSLKALALTDHQAAFSNLWYNSKYDRLNQQRVNRKTVCNAATILARSLYAIAAGNDTFAMDPLDLPSIITANCSLITQLLECLGVDGSVCTDLLGGASTLASGPNSFYTSVFRFGTASTLSKFAHDFIGLRTAFSRGDSCSTTTDCGGAVGVSCVAGLCTDAPVHYHDAYSLGFQWDYTDSKWTVVDETQPLWSESSWNTINVKFYLEDSPVTEGLILGFGILVTIGSFGLSYLMRRFYDTRIKMA